MEANLLSQETNLLSFEIIDLSEITKFSKNADQGTIAGCGGSFGNCHAGCGCDQNNGNCGG